MNECLRKILEAATIGDKMKENGFGRFGHVQHRPTYTPVIRGNKLLINDPRGLGFGIDLSECD